MPRPGHASERPIFMEKRLVRATTEGDRMSGAEHIAGQYTHGNLEAALLAGLRAAGKDVERLSPADMMGADEFHIGGAQATRELAAQLPLRPGARLLDIGCGIGGPARHFATVHDCHVTGIDLTEEFLAVAESLSRRMGLADRLAFRPAYTDRLDFADASFDGATLLHVGMNIPDKAAVFAAVHRVLRPGGFFAVYDVMRLGEGELAFPLPWADGPEASFVEPPETYRAALRQAGFSLAGERDRSAFALDFFARLRARQAQSGPPPAGLNAVLGPAGPQKIANMVALIAAGSIGPVEMIALK
jgi:MPBQ/MSBQ methyltransferase